MKNGSLKLFTKKSIDNLSLQYSTIRHSNMGTSLSTSTNYYTEAYRTAYTNIMDNLDFTYTNTQYRIQNVPKENEVEVETYPEQEKNKNKLDND